MSDDRQAADPEEPCLAEKVVRDGLENVGYLAGGHVGAIAGGLIYQVVKAIPAEGESVPTHTTWAPVRPKDLHLAKLPALDASGNGECGHCAARLPFAELDLVDNNYSCRPCALEHARRVAAPQAAHIHLDRVSLRSRSWVMPLAICGLFAACTVIAVAFAW